MVVAGCEINVRSYTPCRAPVAPTHTHTYTVHYTSQTACSHYIRNCCTVHKPIVRCKDCVNLLLCRQGLQIAFKFRACVFQVVERQKREGDIWTRQTFFTESLRDVVLLSKQGRHSWCSRSWKQGSFSLFFLSPTPRKRHSKSADKAVTVLGVKILAFPVSPAMHCNKANKRVWKESRREDVSCKARDRHQKKQSLKSMALWR